MKILIADDSRAMRQVVAFMLREAGYRGHTIVEAADGVQALEAARTQKPDLIISDWNMPNMNGIDFLKRLREDGSTTPFGFVTTEVSSEMRNLATSHGAAFLIGKPFTATDFEVALDPFLA